ncbi:zinc-ribbon domain-containing protein [Christensenella timonensis]|uniref:zinc-ribbon domain-containing protein n=1 Tax=Christensenella timonensis TaxID=1816678 RepID=UPI00082DAA9D|nr:zinc-ribbon domain-containing protein [Christensenella timonensis]
MADKTLICKDCGAEFVFTEGEQEFFREKGFDNEPVRCPACRKAKKQQRNNFRRDYED